MSTAPIFHLNLPAFRENPYPQLKRMRAEAPIAFVPELNRTLFTRLDAEPVRVGGWAFRWVLNLPCKW